jgi:short-subunit dehydrogenase
MKPAGIHVVTVSPGYIATPMTQVNPYAMPFKLSPENAARKIAHAIRRKSRYRTIPWQMAIVAFVLRLLPRLIYDHLFEKAPRKPRGLKT